MVDSATMSQSHGSQAERSTLVKAQFSALDTAAERGTSVETEAKTSVCTTSGEG